MDTEQTAKATPGAREAAFDWSCAMRLSPYSVAQTRLEVQALHLAGRFGLPSATARLTAALAFGEGCR